MQLKLISILLLLTTCLSWSCNIQYCQECVAGTPAVCNSCAGYYEPDLDSYHFCVINIRLIIATILGVFAGVSIIICGILQLKDYQETKHLKRNSIEAEPSDFEISDQELDRLVWNKGDKRLERSVCTSCMKNGGSAQLSNGQVYHGDCLCWNAKGSGDLRQATCKFHCIQCLRNFKEFPIPVYAELKKRRQRVCDECLAN